MKKIFITTLSIAMVSMLLAGCEKHGCSEIRVREKIKDWSVEHSVKEMQPILSNYYNMKAHEGDTVLLYGYLGPAGGVHKTLDGALKDIYTCRRLGLYEEQGYNCLFIYMWIMNDELAERIRADHPTDKLMYVKGVVVEGRPMAECTYFPYIEVVDFHY